jgi:hypothetical protein
MTKSISLDALWESTTSIAAIDVIPWESTDNAKI